MLRILGKYGAKLPPPDDDYESSDDESINNLIL